MLGAGLPLGQVIGAPLLELGNLIRQLALAHQAGGGFLGGRLALALGVGGACGVVEILWRGEAEGLQRGDRVDLGARDRLAVRGELLAVGVELGAFLGVGGSLGVERSALGGQLFAAPLLGVLHLGDPLGRLGVELVLDLRGRVLLRGFRRGRRRCRLLVGGFLRGRFVGAVVALLKRGDGRGAAGVSAAVGANACGGPRAGGLGGGCVASYLFVNGHAC